MPTPRDENCQHFCHINFNIFLKEDFQQHYKFEISFVFEPPVQLPPPLYSGGHHQGSGFQVTIYIFTRTHMFP